MNDIPALSPPPHQATRPGTTEGAHRHNKLATLRSIIAAWRERKRFRASLAQMSEANPHLIDDIGLTIRQAEEEIAKPFWQR